MTEAGFQGDESRTLLLQGLSAGRKERAADVAHYLVVAEGSECGKRVEIGLAPISLGRRDDNRFSLADPCVSSHHCTIGFEEGQLWVRDLGSTNGTFIDGERVRERAPWPVTATLQVGNQLLRQEYRRRGELQRSAELSEDLRAAAGYVRSLLPPPLPAGAVTTAWQFLPCRELGGDLFDYFWLDSRHFIVYLLDVCGHGVGAALHSVAVSSLLRQQSLANVDFLRPARVLSALSGALPMERYGEMYFTLWYGVYRPDERSLSYACGGHPPALLFDPRGEGPLELLGLDPPVGILGEVDYQEATLALPAGSRLYLYSDGAYEIITGPGEIWGWEAFARLLKDRVRQGQGDPREIFRSIAALTERFEDDFSLLSLEFG